MPPQLPTTGAYTVDVVGESNYQSALRSLAGSPTANGHYVALIAHLVPEPDNQTDPAAVRVDLRNKPVGYLDRHTARVYREWLQKHSHTGEVMQCPAVITGGWKRGNDVGPYGVVLDLGVQHVTRRPMAPRPRQTHRRRRTYTGWLIVAAVVAAALLLLYFAR